jgi:hypothetical protein
MTAKKKLPPGEDTVYCQLCSEEMLEKDAFPTIIQQDWWDKKDRKRYSYKHRYLLCKECSSKTNPDTLFKNALAEVRQKEAPRVFPTTKKPGPSARSISFGELGARNALTEVGDAAVRSRLADQGMRTPYKKRGGYDRRRG